MIRTLLFTLVTRFIDSIFLRLKLSCIALKNRTDTLFFQEMESVFERLHNQRTISNYNRCHSAGNNANERYTFYREASSLILILILINKFQQFTFSYLNPEVIL